MDIVRILRDKRRFLRLLLMADEQENMVEKYLDRGDMYVLFICTFFSTGKPCANAWLRTRAAAFSK